MSRPAVLLNVIVWGIGMGFLTLALAGCALQGLPGMSPEQIRAAGKDATAICTEAFSPWGRGRTVYVNVDRNVIPNGGFNIDKDCAVNFSNSAPPPGIVAPLPIKPVPSP